MPNANPISSHRVKAISAGAFASAQAEKAFLKGSREGQVTIGTIDGPVADGFRQYARGLSADIVFDRASRVKTGTLSPWPRARRRPAPGNQRTAQRAAKEYHKDIKGVEARGICNDEPFLSFRLAMCKYFRCARERVDLSLLVLPSNHEGKHLPMEHDMVFVPLVQGQMNILAGSKRVALELGSMLFLPRGTPFSFYVTKPIILLRASIPSSSLLDSVVGVVLSRMAQNSRWTEPLRGETPNSEVLEEIKIDISRHLEDLRMDELEPMSEPAEPVAPVQPAPQAHAPQEMLYDGRDWNLTGLSRRPSDIHVVTYRRSGTTWMQMIMYQLMTDGDIDKIRHIYEFSPYPIFEMRHAQGVARIEAMASPRVLKSHLTFKALYRPFGKYIYIARDGMDVALSSYYHFINCSNGPIPFDVYMDRFLNEKPGWFEHVAEWAQNRYRENVLFLTYRELTEAPAETVHRLAAFCEVELSPEKMSRILERASFDYMKAREEKFDANAGAAYMRSLTGIKFLRKGKMAMGRERLSPEQQALFRHRSKEVCGDLEL